MMSSKSSVPKRHPSGSLLRWVKRQPRGKFPVTILLVAFFFASISLIWVFRMPDPITFQRATQSRSPLDTSALPSGDRKLAIILPIDRPSPDLCKLIMSAVALGYPSPVIVNWQRDFHTDTEGVGASQLAKITGTLDYLNWATSKDTPSVDQLDDDDIIIMLDALDVWFQLPPDVLLNRYFTALQEADQRLQNEHNMTAEDSIHHTIMIAAQKGCFSPRDSVSNFHCKDVPTSILPGDTYGVWTDTKLRSWRYMRPRYVNSGSIMGPVGDMKRFFGRVQRRMGGYLDGLQDGQELAGDQGVFEEVFGEQSVWRRRLAQDRLKNDGATENTKTRELQQEYEYHVGLDYRQELFYPTCYSEEDGFFVELGHPEAVDLESHRAGISPPRVDGLPADVAVANPPLHTLELAASDQPSWRQLKLYTDFWTTAVPAVIHHNAWKDGLKGRRTTWWDKMWYFPWLRQLMEHNMVPSNDTAPMVEFGATEEPKLRIWPSDRKWSTREPVIFGRELAADDWSLYQAEWEYVCRWDPEDKAWHEEIFRDGKGSL
ncbi:uncharacterized protein F5Z01DRAFT_736471 [Emericellopsis atlantica]|uniref:Uncharacterized protein n=1 Tax=Emericellopsis atlantica TaxID=2614577 RepID=A0A9P8CPD8_9HYPO|nr:uncharacterized protein F5Z01DRAFT_736471 [Emericellopsis atlantica]KAG9254759.1 hypothetical protein F5Z01DRAFT_736471 [Emericellopsis atlantica]